MHLKVVSCSKIDMRERDRERESIPGLIAEIVLNCNFSYKSLLPQCILKNENMTIIKKIHIQ